MDQILHDQLLIPLLSTSPGQLLFPKLVNTTNSQECKTTVDLKIGGGEGDVPCSYKNTSTEDNTLVTPLVQPGLFAQ